jgi:hypothetical protein
VVVVVVVVIIRRLFIAEAFDLKQVHVGLVAGRVALGQVLRWDFGFPKLWLLPQTLTDAI